MSRVLHQKAEGLPGFGRQQKPAINRVRLIAGNIEPQAENRTDSLTTQRLLGCPESFLHRSRPDNQEPIQRPAEAENCGGMKPVSGIDHHNRAAALQSFRTDRKSQRSGQRTRFSEPFDQPANGETSPRKQPGKSSLLFRSPAEISPCRFLQLRSQLFNHQGSRRSGRHRGIYQYEQTDII